MTLRVGRAGFDAGDFEISSWDVSGDSVSVSGVLSAWSTADVAALRQQLNGYVDNPDEPAVPVTWSADPTVDGFYRVEGVSVGASRAMAPRGVMDFSLSLERVRGFSAPLIETSILGAVRENDHGITSAARAAIGVPDAAVEFADSSTTGPAQVRASEDGDVRVVANNTLVRRQTWAVPAEHYYDGSARITVDGKVVVGDQVPHAPTGWQLSNGIIRMSIDGDNTFQVSTWTGSEWTDPRGFILTGDSGSTALDVAASAVGLRVLRNAPEECIVRLTLTPSAALRAFGELRAHVDVAVRRGERSARLLLSLSTPLTDPGARFGLAGFTSPEFHVGGYSVIATPDPIRLAVAVPRTHQADNTNQDAGFWVEGSTTEMAFGVGFADDTAPSSAQQVIYEYYGATSEAARVASR